MNTEITRVEAVEAREQVERIVRSHVFEKAQRSQRFLRYVVEAALHEPPLAVKEYSVAMDVFDRDASYDPAIDATVRVEASRLRNRLREYYAEEGRDDQVVIEVPKGGYAVAISRRDIELAFAPVVEPAMLVADAGLPVHEPMAVERDSRWLSGGRLGVVVLLLLLVAGGGFWMWRRQMHRLALARAPRSLAVLPIANGTGEPGLAYLGDGLTNSLIRQLSYVPALKLTAHDSVFHFRNRTVDARAAGQALGVANVLTGELHESGDHLVLTAELSSVQDGSVIFSREYQAEGNDLRQVQADIQRDIVSGLKVENSARDPARNPARNGGMLTSSAEAYREFLEGEFTAQGGSPEGLHKAIGHFERAVELDPRFDLAWADLAGAHVLLGLYSEAPREHMPLGRRYAERAIELNPSLGDAHGDLGVIHLVYDWDVAAAESELALASAQQAAISTLSCTAHLLERTGRPHVAEEILGRLISYDPQSASLIAELGCVAFYRGNYEAAIQHYREALRDDPHSPVPYWGLGKSFNQEGRYGEALEAIGQFKRLNGFEPPLLTAETGYALGASGKKQEAEDTIRGLLERGRTSFVDPYLIAIIYLSMNDRDEAFAWLDKAFEAKSTFLISLPTEPKWEPVRSDPRFGKFVEKMLQKRSTTD